MALVAASILSADFSRLGEQIKMVEEAGVDRFHFDVMDGKFVPEISMGPFILRSIRRKTELPIDVHLMVRKPTNYIIERFVWADVNSIIFHFESIVDPEKMLHLFRVIIDKTDIERFGAIKFGMAINPETSIERLQKILGKIDLVLIMTVDPGFAGQGFMPEVLPKIWELRKIIEKKELNCKIMVDGGINVEEPKNTARQAREAGADILVAGSAIFGAKDPKQVIQKMKKL
jgi:ribulose-phosphate 3-epimerase